MLELKRYNPNQERDWHGRFGHGSGGRSLGATIEQLLIGNSVAGGRNGESMVFVDLRKVDKRWGNRKGQRVPPDPQKTNFKLNRAKEFITGMKPGDANKFKAPSLVVQKNGAISFSDGHHRFAAMRDLGVKAAPVSMNAESVAHAKRLGLIVKPPAPPKPKVVAPPPKPPVEEPKPDTGKKKWSWKAEPRKSGFAKGVDVSPMTLKHGRDFGFFRTKKEAVAFTRKLTAGLPENDHDGRAIWNGSIHDGDPAIRVTAKVGTYGRIQRTIRRDSEHGGLVVSHDLYTLPHSEQGKGHAKRMMRTSLATYDEIGVGRIEVHANIDVGGYAWARMGFVPDRPGALRSAIKKRLRAKSISHSDRAEIHRILETSPRHSWAYEVSRHRLGKRLLLGTDWHGHVDLNNDHHRASLAEALA